MNENVIHRHIFFNDMTSNETIKTQVAKFNHFGQANANHFTVSMMRIHKIFSFTRLKDVKLFLLHDESEIVIIYLTCSLNEHSSFQFDDKSQ